MEGILLLFGIGSIVVVVGSIAGLIAAASIKGLRDENRRVRDQFRTLRGDFRELENQLFDLNIKTKKLEHSVRPAKTPPAEKIRKPEPEIVEISPAAAVKMIEKKKKPRVTSRPSRSRYGDVGLRERFRHIAESAKEPEAPEEIEKENAKPEKPEEVTPEPEKPKADAPEVREEKLEPAEPEEEKEAVKDEEFEKLLEPAAEKEFEFDSTQEEVPDLSYALADLHLTDSDRGPEPSVPRRAKRAVPARAWAKVESAASQDWWKKFEESVGKRWITWVGAVVLIISAGFFVQYAAKMGWLGEWARVGIGIMAGLAAVGTGVFFMKKDKNALGQGIVGAGLGTLYVSLWATCGYFHLLSPAVAFGLMIAVTAGGMALAVIFDAAAISFLAVLGGFITPILVSTGQDHRDLLFAYILLLDLGVLGVAFFKKWRALDVLAFTCTWSLWFAWYFQFYSADAARTPAVLWLGAFFLVFLLQPFVYHMRLRTPITGERFFLAVTNAAGMFAMTYKILHPYPECKLALGMIVLGMAWAYLILGAFIRKRIEEDEKAVFSFMALCVLFLTLVPPIFFNMEAVMISWAIEAPILLYLAFKYNYLPIRIGCLVPFFLAAVRIFIPDWSSLARGSRLFIDPGFGSAILVAIAGAAYAIIHHLHKGQSKPVDRVIKVVVGLFSAFLALVVIHVEVWSWLKLAPDRYDMLRWAPGLVWVVGAAAFLIAGMKLKSIFARLGGFAALAVAAVLLVWDFAEFIPASYVMFFNGRFLVTLAGALVVFAFSMVYRRSKETCNNLENDFSSPLLGFGIIVLVLAVHTETWQWFSIRGYMSGNYIYAAWCVLPLVWALGTAAYLAAGIRRKSQNLRIAGVYALGVSTILAAAGYFQPAPEGYRILFNWRFALALAVPLMVYAYAVLMRLKLLRKVFDRKERAASTVFHGIGILTLAVLLTVEVAKWFELNNYHYANMCLLSIIWVAAAGGYLITGLNLRSMPLRMTGLAALGVACALAIAAYVADAREGYLMFLNFRFVALALIPAMVYTYAFVIRRLKKTCTGPEQVVAIVLHGIGIFALISLLSAETARWFNVNGLHYISRCVLPVIWVAGSGGYLLTGIRLRSAPLRGVGIAVLAVASALTVFGYVSVPVEGYSMYFNLRFLSGLIVTLMVFVMAGTRQRLKNIFTISERASAIAYFGIGILFLVALATTETSAWLNLRGLFYYAWCIVPLFWLAGAGGYLFSGIKLKTSSLRGVGTAFLAVGMFLITLGYFQDLRGELGGYTIFFNLRFLLALGAPLAVYAYALTLRGFRKICTEYEGSLAVFFHGLGIFSIVILMTTETSLWLDSHNMHYLLRCVLPLYWVAGVAAYLATGLKVRSAPLRGFGLFVLAVGAILAAFGYSIDISGNYLLYINGRFLAALAVVLMAFLHGFFVRYFHRVCPEKEREFAKTIYSMIIAGLFVLLSRETYLYFINTVADPAKAKQAAQAGLSVVWGVYAIGLLALGFWRNIRPYRLCALALFGITALKLVIVDMARVKDVYRIISFMALGLLMIGASYLYHRVEKRFFATGPEDEKEEKETREQGIC